MLLSKCQELTHFMKMSPKNFVFNFNIKRKIDPKCRKLKNTFKNAQKRQKTIKLKFHAFWKA